MTIVPDFQIYVTICSIKVFKPSKVTEQVTDKEHLLVLICLLQTSPQANLLQFDQPAKHRVVKFQAMDKWHGGKEFEKGGF